MKLDICCGKAKKPGFEGVDWVKLPGVDHVMDVNKGLKFDDNSVDEIFTKDTIQHLKDVIFVLGEFHRVLKVGGKLEVVVPHFTHNRAFNPFHKHHFSLHTFDWFDTSIEIGNYRSYYNKTRFKVLKRRINIRKNILLPWTYVADWFFNLSPRLQHIYETYLCFMMPAVNLHFILEKESRDKEVGDFKIYSDYKKKR